MQISPNHETNVATVTTSTQIIRNLLIVNEVNN